MTHWRLRQGEPTLIKRRNRRILPTLAQLFALRQQCR
jgi:hypothetical protein